MEKGMRRKMKKGFFLTVLAWMAFICLAAAGYAREIDQMPDLEPGRKGSLSVALSYKNEAGQSVKIEGVTLQAFKVADLTVINGGSSTYTLTEDFAGSQIAFDGMGASDSNQAAKALKAIVLEKGLKGQASVTDANGKAYFKDLEPAMYLVVQTANADTVPLYTEMDPYLVSVPMGDTGSGSNTWKYDVDTIPKTEVGRKPTTCSIVVNKRVTMRVGDELVLLNAVDSTFYVGLFKDAEGTKPYSEDYLKPVRIVNASSGQVKYTGLTEGVYYVFETDKNGKIIKNGETPENTSPVYTCVVEGSGEQKVALDPAAGAAQGTVEFNNVYDDLPRGYYAEAEIGIKKNVLQGDDRVNVEDTFYAGLFTKAGNAYLLNQVVELEQNETVTVPVILEGGDGTEPAEYWIFETDKDGNRLDKSAFSYEVSGEGSVKLGKENLNGSIEITNRIKEEAEEPETNGTGKGTSKKVKTGDDTPIALYVVLCAGALLILVILIRRNFRKQV